MATKRTSLRELFKKSGMQSDCSDLRLDTVIYMWIMNYLGDGMDLEEGELRGALAELEEQFLERMCELIKAVNETFKKEAHHG